MGITRTSIFLSRAFSSMFGGHWSVTAAFSALLTEALEITSGLWSGSIEFHRLVRRLVGFCILTFDLVHSRDD